MARLNTANPQVINAPRRTPSLKDQGSKYTDTPSKGSRASGHLPRASAQKHKKSTSTEFDIFSDNVATEESVALDPGKERSSASHTKQKKKRTLKGAHVNSLLLPFQQAPRQRPAIKEELDDYEKENYTAGDFTEIFEAPIESLSQRTPPRRNAPGTPMRRQPNDRPLSPLSPQTEPADGDHGDDSFNSLDDFIVSDNDEPSYHETSDSETMAEKCKTPSPPPKPTRRRLMRGKKPSLSTAGTGTDDCAVGVPFSLDPKIPDPVKSPARKSSPRHLFQDDLHLSTKLNELSIEDDKAINSQLKTDIMRPIIELDPKPKKTERLKTKQEKCPSSPMQEDLHPESQCRSPTRGNSRIPPTPYCESSDAFWSQNETDDWVDYHSPRKPEALSPSMMEYLREFDGSDSTVSSRGSSEPDILPAVGIKLPVAPKSPSKTAIKKAVAAENREAKKRRAEFDAQKAEYAQTFLEALDRTVTGGQILDMAESGGGVQIVWSKNLISTAGRATWSTSTERATGNALPSSTLRHHCKIELAERIITSQYRILNTITHEYCHLANYMISNVRNKPHGTSFHAWGKTCDEAMKDHPLYGGQIHVTTKHSYSIDFKYMWSCVDCQHEYGRHSKSINTLRSRCGFCHGVLEQVKPKPRNVSKKTTTSPEAQIQ